MLNDEGLRHDHPNWCEVTGPTCPSGFDLSITGHFGIANARLIAASPDLLAVCQRIIAEHESDGEISIGCIEDARAAVKKATQPDEEA